MTVAAPLSQGRRTLGVSLLVAAVAVGLIPGILGSVRFAVWFSTDLLFLLYPAAAAVAFALALTGFLLLRTRQLRDGPFIAAVVLLGLNLAAAAWASLVWFSSMTCSGGYSGPCYEPFILCGGGFLMDIVAIILVVIGVTLPPRVPPPTVAGPHP